MHRFLAPILILGMIVAGCVPMDISGDETSSSSRATSPLPAGDFSGAEEGNPQGTAYVRGYATVESVPQPFCEQDCTMHDTVMFHVTQSNTPGFTALLAQSGTDTDAGILGDVALGCRDADGIRYFNDSDANPMGEFRIAAPVATAILTSTASNTVALQLTKDPLSGGRGAPECYSHFTAVALWTGSSASTSPAAPAPRASGGCKIAGCSAQLCVEETDEGMSTCEFRAEYACYQTATCGRLASGSCGWSDTPALRRCLADPPTPVVPE